MTGKKKRRDEPERDTAIESALTEIRASIAGLAERLDPGGAQHRFGTPVAFKPVFFPAMVPDQPAPTQNIPLGSTCMESIELSMDGEHVYARVAISAACVGPTAAQVALAALEARKELLRFGIEWCQTAGNNCTDRNCIPSLSELKVTGQKAGQRTEGDKRVCFVTVTVSGMVSCKCSNQGLTPPT